jgi:ABC-type lipoprotein export system ATPase subunit
MMGGSLMKTKAFGTEAFVRLEEAGRTYTQDSRPVQALKSATCDILPGDRIAIMGPSGSGKSTLLHLMGGLDTPSAGSVWWPVMGEMKELRPAFIGFVFQMQSLIPSLNVVENVELPLLILNEDAGEARTSAIEVLNKLELCELIYKLPEELSGGQLQRVALARALVSRPLLLLADEPTGQLDHPTAQHLFDVLLRYIEDSETALVVATHDPAIAERMQKTWKINYGILEVPGHDN